MLEGKWDAVAPQSFTADGSSTGQIQVADTAGFRIKQVAYLKDNSNNTLPVQIKRVLSPTLLIVGQVDNKIASWLPLDISAWTVAIGSRIGAEQQNKANIPTDDHYRAIYESDPVVADRVVQVDKYGNYYDDNNPMPIVFDGTVEIGEVEVIGKNGNTIEPNMDGSINVNIVEEIATNQKLKVTYAEDDTVVGGVSTDLVSYTCPVGKKAILFAVDASGENIAKFTVLINSVVQMVKRTYFGGDLNAQFRFGSGDAAGYILNEGDVVDVQVIHYRPATGTFEGTIQVIEIT